MGLWVVVHGFYVHNGVYSFSDDRATETVVFNFKLCMKLYLNVPNMVFLYIVRICYCGFSLWHNRKGVIRTFPVVYIIYYYMFSYREMLL